MERAARRELGAGQAVRASLLPAEVVLTLIEDGHAVADRMILPVTSTNVLSRTERATIDAVRALLPATPGEVSCVLEVSVETARAHLANAGAVPVRITGRGRLWDMPKPPRMRRERAT